MGFGGEGEDREGLEHGCVEAARGGGVYGLCGGGVHVENKVSTTMPVSATELTASSSEKIPASVEVETDHEDDDEEENNYGS